MTNEHPTQVLITRFREKDRDLNSQLEDLLNREFNNELSDVDKILLGAYREVFDWEPRYVIHCDYKIPVDSISGSVILDTLEEYSSVQIDELVQGVDYDDIHIDDSDFCGGDVYAESKEIEVRKLRLKDLLPVYPVPLEI